MVSQKAKYALRALVALAKEGDSLMISEIAARKNIPRKFLEQILLEMKRHGIVHSRRGKLGGYSLLLPPDKITYGQVRPPAVSEPHRLPALLRLPERSGLRDQAGFCQGRRVGKTGARPHHHRRFPRFSTSWRRGRGHWTRTGAALRASLNSSNWKQILSLNRFVAGGASTHMKKW